jgi:putative FmdB family regulatory protein
MPTYEYECQQCKKTFEYFQRVSEKPKKVCEECGGKLVRLVSGGAGLIFKGTGFYATDYKKRSEAKETRKQGKKPAEKSEAKPETTSSTEKPKATAAGGGEGEG